MLIWKTAGESHGPALITYLEGVPAGLALTTEVVAEALAERRLGYGRGARQKFEQDVVRIISGVRQGKTTGSPIVIEVANSEWPKWSTVMSPDPVDAADLMVDAGKGDRREMARNKPLTTPRPGHADLAGMMSYRSWDARDILERASARETAARVVAGVVAKRILLSVSGTEITSHVVQVGPERCEDPPLPEPETLEALRTSPFRTLDSGAESRFKEVVDQAKRDGETVGGVAEIWAWNVPVGLGSHVSGEQKLDANLAAAMMSIQSVKAVEIGDGFASAARFGSAAHDELGTSAQGSVVRHSNRAGGIEGGTSNGEPISVRVGFKPISTVPQALDTVDLATGTPSKAFHQRSDTAQVVPGAVIGEAMMALTLASALLERYGGRSLAEVQEQFQAQQKYVEANFKFERDDVQ